MCRKPALPTWQTVRLDEAGYIEILQSVLDAFLNAPLLFLVPLLLLGFIIWSPWSPGNFYLHHDLEHLDVAQPVVPVEDEPPKIQ